jgi:PIN domain nuclease of toxin-antitoxin system
VILLDTHVVVWLAFDPSRLSRKARTAIDRAREQEDGLAISDITLLELTTLASKGHIRLDISLESFLLEVKARFVDLAASESPHRELPGHDMEGKGRLIVAAGPNDAYFPSALFRGLSTRPPFVGSASPGVKRGKQEKCRRGCFNWNLC